MNHPLLIISVFALLSLSSAGLYDSSSPVKTLDATNFKPLVLESPGVWFVEFYAPWCGHCQRLAPEWEKLAKSFNGIVHIGAVDMTVSQQVGAPYNIQGFPTLKFFGEDKSNPIDYSGSRSATDMINFVLDQVRRVATDRLRSKPASTSGGSQQNQESSQPQGSPEPASEEDVIVLTDDNFEELVTKSEDAWMIEFYAPWCGHCKNLQPEWNALSKKVKGQFKVAKVDATVNSRLASRFGVSAYPTIKFFPSGKKVDGLVEDYVGSRDSTSMANWGLEKKEAGSQLELAQLTNSDSFKKYCKEAKAACLIVFLPHIYDSSKEERNNYLQTIGEVQVALKGKPLTFLWSQAGDQFQLEDQLGLGSGYPAVVAISFRKTVFAVMRGSFSKEGLLGFTNNIIAGKENFRPFQELPSIKVVEKWDGEDKKPEVKEEDLAAPETAPEKVEDREL